MPKKVKNGCKPKINDEKEYKSKRRNQSGIKQKIQEKIVKRQKLFLGKD